MLLRARALGVFAAVIAGLTTLPSAADTFAASDAQVLNNATFFQDRHWTWKGRIGFYDAPRVPAILRANAACTMTATGATWYFGIVDGSRTQPARLDFRPQLPALHLIYDPAHLNLAPLNGTGATYSNMELGCPGTKNGYGARLTYVLVLDNVYVGNEKKLTGDFARSER